MENLSAADVAAVTRGNYGAGDGFGFGGGSGIWLFAILALMWGGFGGNRFGAADGRCATVEDINTTTNFARLESQVQNNGQAVSQGFTNLGNGICQLGYQQAIDKGDLSKQISECCCDSKQGILENRYLSAQNTAAINANTTAQVQKVLDKLCSDQAAAMQARIQQLELQSALCGVVRFPTQATYTAGFPFGNHCGCGFSGNI